MKALNWLCTLWEEREKAGGLLHYPLTRLHRHAWCLFLWTGANFKQISSAYHILSFAVYTGSEWAKEAGEEEEEGSWSWPKNNSLRMLSMSQRHKATLSNIYWKAVPVCCAEGGILRKKWPLKMIQKHLCSSTLDRTSSPSGLIMVLHRERKILSFTLGPEFNPVIIWASIGFFSVTDACCNSVNALGSWGGICICMIGLHNE